MKFDPKIPVRRGGKTLNFYRIIGVVVVHHVTFVGSELCQKGAFPVLLKM